MSKKNWPRRAPVDVDPRNIEPTRTETAEFDDEPGAIGWVYLLDGVNGYVSRKVRVPVSMLEDLAIEPPRGPDLRPTLVQLVMMDSMTDQFLQDLSKESQK